MSGWTGVIALPQFGQNLVSEASAFPQFGHEAGADKALTDHPGTEI